MVALSSRLTLFAALVSLAGVSAAPVQGQVDVATNAPSSPSKHGVTKPQVIPPPLHGNAKAKKGLHRKHKGHKRTPIGSLDPQSLAVRMAEMAINGAALRKPRSTDENRQARFAVNEKRSRFSRRDHEHDHDHDNDNDDHHNHHHHHHHHHDRDVEQLVRRDGEPTGRMAIMSPTSDGHMKAIGYILTESKEGNLVAEADEHRSTAFRMKATTNSTGADGTRPVQLMATDVDMSTMSTEERCATFNCQGGGNMLMKKCNETTGASPTGESQIFMFNTVSREVTPTCAAPNATDPVSQAPSTPPSAPISARDNSQSVVMMFMPDEAAVQAAPSSSSSEMSTATTTTTVTATVTVSSPTSIAPATTSQTDSASSTALPSSSSSSEANRAMGFEVVTATVSSTDSSSNSATSTATPSATSTTSTTSASTDAATVASSIATGENLA